MVTLLTAGVLALALQGPVARNPAALDTAIARMGGAAALGRIERVRSEMITQWQRTSFAEVPYADQPSYEIHSDVRDYSIPAWRNTRRFQGARPGPEIVDIVRDSVAIRRIGPAPWAPLNVAYVDERRELFAFAPERVLLLAHAAADLRAVADTTLGGQQLARVAATIEGFPATIFFRRGDGLPAFVRYRAAQPNDFGLAPWGPMEVEVWYSSWSRTPAGVNLPRQLDIRRVGRPYKRITVLAMAFDTVATADSFAVRDSLRAGFLATARKPMYDLPLDSAKIVEGRFATFGAFGTPPGAVKVGGHWLLLEAGQAPLSTERAAAWLRKQEPGAVIASAWVTTPLGANGGAAWLAAQKIPVYGGPGAMPFLTTILRNHRERTSAASVVSRAQWRMVDGDSVWVEPMDFPDAPGALLLYVPSLKWAYSGMAAAPLQVEYLMRRLADRGFTVERIGSLRGLVMPAPK